MRYCRSRPSARRQCAVEIRAVQRVVLRWQYPTRTVTSRAQAQRAACAAVRAPAGPSVVGQEASKGSAHIVIARQPPEITQATVVRHGQRPVNGGSVKIAPDRRLG